MWLCQRVDVPAAEAEAASMGLLRGMRYSQYDRKNHESIHCTIERNFTLQISFYTQQQLNM